MLVSSGKFMVAMAALWATGASLFIFFYPISTQGVTGTLYRNSRIVIETYSREQSWYGAQGLWGIFVLVVFTGLYLLLEKSKRFYQQSAKVNDGHGVGTASELAEILEKLGDVTGALDLGIDFLDTANVYGNGVSEQVIGAFIKDHPGRFTIATTGNTRFAPP